MKIFLNRISVTEKNSWKLVNIKKAFRNHREISLPKEKKKPFSDMQFAICRLAEHFFSANIEWDLVYTCHKILAH